MARLAVMAHLTPDELERRYRRARDPVARSQWQIVWLVAQSRSGREAAAATGYSTKWVGLVVRRYNADGPAGVGDRRRANPGRAPVLSAEQRAALHARLAAPPPDGGLWSGPKVAAWIEQQTGRAVGPQCGWEYLVRLGCALRRPRPRHAKADAAAQEGFKKGGSPTRSGRSSAPIPMPA
jgi:transposase